MKFINFAGKVDQTKSMSNVSRTFMPTSVQTTVHLARYENAKLFHLAETWHHDSHLGSFAHTTQIVGPGPKPIHLNVAQSHGALNLDYDCIVLS
jgi:hypothetical protein